MSIIQDTSTVTTYPRHEVQIIVDRGRDRGKARVLYPRYWTAGDAAEAGRRYVDRDPTGGIAAGHVQRVTVVDWSRRDAAGYPTDVETVWTRRS